jgi:hypothetical protein
MAIAHAPCKLRVLPYGSQYAGNAAVKKRFHKVRLLFDDAGKTHLYITGWVEQRYVVTDTGKVTWPGANKALEFSASVVPVQPYMGDDEHSPEPYNYADFRYPQYKGGENQPPPPKRTYYKGKRGGCYYRNSAGKKVYVDKRYCGGKK